MFGRLHFLARPVAASLCEARTRCSLLVHANDYSLVVDLGESRFAERKNFSRKVLSFCRPSNFTINKSKTANKIAAIVSHAQIAQNKMNRSGCSRGSSADCKNVEPENKNRSASTSSTNIVLRRIFRSRIAQRDA